MLYVALPESADNTRAKSATEVEIKAENGQVETVKVIAHAKKSNNDAVLNFITQNKNIKEKAIIASNAQDIEDIFVPLLEDLVVTSGGKLTLVSARELVDEPRSLLSGSTSVIEEVIAKSSLEIAEYFRQALRSRESLSVLNPALLTASRNGFNIHFIILPPGQTVRNLNVFATAFLVLLTDSNLDIALVRIAQSIEARKEVKRATTRQIRKELNDLNKDLLRQTRADGAQRKEMMSLINQLNETKETDDDSRIAAAKRFMTDRERKLQENGLLWSITPEEDDLNAKLSQEYQNLRIDLERARQELSAAKQGTDKSQINETLIRVRQQESALAACRAKIANDSVLALHHQLKSQRDQTRLEQNSTLRQQQTSGANDNELLVTHTEAQRRLISTLEDDIETIIQQHQHHIDRMKQRQLDTLHKYRQLVEGSYNDKILRLECLLHELITDNIQT